MHPAFKVIVWLILPYLFFNGCHTSTSNSTSNKTVFLKYENGKYSLFRNRQPFLIKGGSGYTNLKTLSEAGGNTIRVWDTLNLGKILDSAQKYDLAVVVGLPMPPNKNMDVFYDDETKVSDSFKQLTAVVNRYKNHPALLCWCLGNELDFPIRPRFNKFYTAFNNLVDMIHHDDPNHPVTTTMMTFNRKNITDIKWRTKVDFISFNIFGSIETLKNDLVGFNWFWNGPFLITEWGIEGPWVAEKRNAWGAYVEDSSPKKAEELLAIYQRYMPVNNPGYLGSMVFYWGQKQELTPTWFSLFDENGAPTALVNTMHYIWTGKPPATKAPPIKYMLVNGMGGHDNILLKPNILASARLFLDTPDTTGLTYKWQLIVEDWYNPNGKFSEKKPKEISNSVVANNRPDITFKTPENEGPYRLLVYVYNRQGYMATCNTPFYVVNNP